MSRTDPIAPSMVLDPDPILSTTQVGELFEVHPSTVKRWCERGELEFERTDGGHRRIRLGEALRRELGGAVAQELAEFGSEAGSVWLAEQRAVQEGDFGPGRDLARSWLEDRAYARIRDLLLYLGRNHPDMLPGLLDEIARGVMREVGHWWEEGRLSVGEEHLASETLVEAIFQLRRETARIPSSPRGPVALVGCAEGEHHSMGASCLRLVLERAGWEVRFVGADAPLDSWSELQREYGARLVCISFSSLRAWGDVVRTVGRLAGTYDPDMPYTLALGGGMAATVTGEAGAVRTEGLARLSDRTPFRDVGVFPDTREFMSWASERDLLGT